MKSLFKTLLAGVPREDAQGIITAPIGAHYGIKVLKGTKVLQEHRDSKDQLVPQVLKVTKVMREHRVS